VYKTFYIPRETEAKRKECSKDGTKKEEEKL